MNLLCLADIEQYVRSRETEALVEAAWKNELRFSYAAESEYSHLTGQELADFLDGKTAEKYPGPISRRIREEILDIQGHLDEYGQLFACLGDERSKDTLCGLLAFRLTRDERYMAKAFCPDGEQYFEEGIVALPPDCVFVDCGAFDGDTAAAFACHVKGYKHMYLFEPMEEYARKCRVLFPAETVSVCNAAVAEVEQTVKMQLSVPGSSRLSEEGEVEVQTVCLDEAVPEAIGFLKMDIEGAEAAALAGCRKHIAEDSPVMALCVYHRPSDLYAIPRQIRTYNDSYTFYLRHYTLWADETVLYAIPRRQDLIPLKKGEGSPEPAVWKKYREVLARELRSNRDARRFLLGQYWGAQEQYREKDRQTAELIRWADELTASRDFFEKQYREKDRQTAELIRWADELTASRDLFERQYQEKDRQAAELIQWSDQLAAARDALEEQYREKDRQTAELIRWADELTASRDLFERQYQEKDRQAAELIRWADELTEARDFLQQQCDAKENQIGQLQKAEQQYQVKIAELENTVAKQRYKLNLLLGDEKIRKIAQKKHYEIG